MGPGRVRGHRAAGHPPLGPPGRRLTAVEVGWRLGRPYWGRGLATEAARAALHFGFADRGLDRIVSICQTGNAASERIMRKLGMRLDRDTMPPGGRPVRVYALDRDGYVVTARVADRG